MKTNLLDIDPPTQLMSTKTLLQKQTITGRIGTLAHASCPDSAAGSWRPTERIH
jgi:hypothetical protein